MLFLIILSLGSATLVVTAALLWRYPVQVSASVVVLVGIVDCLQLWTSGITLGVFVYPNDIACATLLAAGAIVTVRNGSVSREFCWGALLLFGLTIIDFLRGAITYGIKPAGNQARNIAYLLVPIVAFTAMQVNRRVSLSRITLWLCGVSWVFVAVAVFRWLGVLPTPEDVVASDAIRDVVRVVPADGAMIIGPGADCRVSDADGSRNSNGGNINRLVFRCHLSRAPTSKRMDGYERWDPLACLPFLALCRP